MMTDTNKTQSIRSLQREFHNALVYARTEAVARNQVVSICASSNGASCSTEWGGGWLIFIDNSSTGYADGVLDTGEALLRVNEYTGRAIASVVDPDDSSAKSAIVFSLRGLMYDSTRAYVQICPSDADDGFARGLMLERSGRVSYSRDSDGNGVHDRIFEDDSGAPDNVDLDC
ncbi:GspH/FimT family protein [Saccharophagus degradans]|uniref:Type II secretion system protein H n=1 Tax=Saccharophagus degradans TaxID=86304 RepID=A0AAW7XAJ6_9GAMM|nr:GspH/FimT family protein [Saccharophagus degradans]MDO6424682.1 GspH/FimT family protein [Saccharophagus degradans]MDO6609015.1 GspH/FimT family protein [Saccharophagus degradans]